MLLLLLLLLLLPPPPLLLPLLLLPNASALRCVNSKVRQKHCAGRDVRTGLTMSLMPSLRTLI